MSGIPRRHLEFVQMVMARAQEEGYAHAIITLKPGPNDPWQEHISGTWFGERVKVESRARHLLSLPEPTSPPPPIKLELDWE